MNFKYSAIIAVLAAGILAAPAMAGVSNATGGTNKQSYIDKSVDKSTSQVIGHMTINGCWGQANGYSGSGRDVYNSGVIKVDYSNPTGNGVDALIKQAKNTVDSIGRNAVASGGRGSYYGSTMTTSTTEEDNRTYEYEDDDSNNAYNGGEFSSETTTTDNRGYGYTATANEGNTILVGDTDNYNDTYAAQGNSDRTLVVKGDYAKKTVYRINGSGYVSPIVFDLDNDGKIEASNGKYLPHSCSFDKSTKAVMFDFYGNGFPVMMEWVGANDGLLVRPHKDGSIDGTCLFGISNGYDNGYDELASLDIDKNGALEGAELTGLMVWSDKNTNGIADDGELMTLDSLKITSIGVNHNNYASTYVCNGKTQKTFDWWPCVLDCRKVSVNKI